VISERTTEALAARKEAGLVVGRVPFGYQRVGDFVAINDSEQKTIRVALQLRREGYSQRVIAEKLNAAGHAARGRGDRPTRWNQLAISRLLRKYKGAL
jgi:DNA invertase Pin-like site-specific DNA recombinase